MEQTARDGLGPASAARRGWSTYALRSGLTVKQEGVIVDRDQQHETKSEALHALALRLDQLTPRLAPDEFERLRDALRADLIALSQHSALAETIKRRKQVRKLMRRLGYRTEAEQPRVVAAIERALDDRRRTLVAEADVLRALQRVLPGLRACSNSNHESLLG